MQADRLLAPELSDVDGNAEERRGTISVFNGPKPVIMVTVTVEDEIATVADDTDLEEVYNTERHMLYFACTRARDHLLVTSVAPASEFLDDLQM